MSKLYWQFYTRKVIYMKNNTLPAHPSYHRMLKLSPEVAIVTNFCKSFVVEDEEFYNNPNTQANKHNPDFWIDLGNHVSMILNGHLTTTAMKNKTDTIPLIDYMMCQRFRGEMIDIVISAIEQFLNNADEEGFDD